MKTKEVNDIKKLYPMLSIVLSMIANREIIRPEDPL